MHEILYPHAFHLLGIRLYTAWNMPELAHHSAMVVIAMEALDG